MNRCGISAPELVAVLTITGLLLTLALPQLSGRLDRMAVHNAAADVSSAFAIARQTAIARGRYVTVAVDSATRAVRVTMGADTLQTRHVGVVHGVDIRSNRDSLSYDPIGHGYGASNQSIFVTRGAAAETVVVSRLGRVRYRD
jgi:Tfp pilus assembly protein FimT